MDQFIERMMERTRRRQELLDSVKEKVPSPVKQSSVMPQPSAILQPSTMLKSAIMSQPSVMSQSLEMPQPSELPQPSDVHQISTMPQSSTIPQSSEIFQPSSLTQPSEIPQPLAMPEPSTDHVATSLPASRQRRTRLADLASRVDLWLSEENTIQVHSNKQNNENVPPLEINKNASPLKHQQPKQYQQQPKSKLKSDINISRLQQSDNKRLPQRQSLSLTSASLSVAQRRALFEKNIVAQQQIKKPITTTVTISLTKTTAATATAITTTTTTANVRNENRVTMTANDTESKENKPVSENINSPPTTNWTPPCIKNVLLKKNLIDEVSYEQQQITDDKTCPTTADRIVKSVGRVRFTPPSKSGGLYPDLSLIEDDHGNETTSSSSPVENQFTGCKRRSNGINAALNSSTASSESAFENIDDDKSVASAKRSRCEHDEVANVKMTNEAVVIAEEGFPDTPNTVATSTPAGGQSNGSLSQTCTSFTFYNSTPNSNHMFEPVGHSSAELIFNSPSDKVIQQPCALQLVGEGKSSGFEPANRQVSTKTKPALVHTISTYRKQQQQLRLGGTLSTVKDLKKHSKCVSEEDEDSHSVLLQRRLQLLDYDYDNDDDDDEEDYNLQELETAAERARLLERTVVPEQDRIIEQATQALNICDMYRQKSGRSVISSNFSAEHVHAERLLLIAGLRRTEAVREAQRLRVERTLLPGNTAGERFSHLKVNGNGKRLVIESLRVPILSALLCGGNTNNKSKHSSNEGVENLTRWPGGYRYFVCAVRAVATAFRPPMTAATRPADAVEESVRRFSENAILHGDDGTGNGYVEFITKKNVKCTGRRKGAMPSESVGAPIMIHGLDNGGWKITVELYGLSPTISGDHDHHTGSNNIKDHDSQENTKSVLDKLWSTVTTPSKESKKHCTSSGACIESPGGPMAVRNTVFRQLGYFVFSDGQVNRQQFTLNKVYQSGGASKASNMVVEETVRVRMRILEDGEEYAYHDDDLDQALLNEGGCARNTKRTLLTLPSECKRTEGFLTLFDDHELRSTPAAFGQERKWHRHSDIGDGISSGTTLWRRLWFRIDIIDDPKQDNIDSNGVREKNEITRRQKTIVLHYWMYPEHAEQQREPMGAIDLGCCLPLQPPKTDGKVIVSEKQPAPAAPAPPDLCARPNTLRLLLYTSATAHNDDNTNLMNDHDGPLLLAADMSDERREWCDTINAAVRAIGEYREHLRVAMASRLKQKEKEKEHQQHLQREQQRTNAWPTTPVNNSKNCSKKKKFYK